MRGDIDKALRRIVTEMGELAKNPLLRELQNVAFSVAVLATYMVDQERRIRDLESKK